MAKRLAVVPGVTIYTRKGGIWWIDIFQNGKRTRKSLKVTNRAKALTLAHELADEILNLEWNVQIATTLTIEKAIERYKESKSNHAAGTKDNVSHILSKFTEFQRARGLVLLDRVRVEDMEAYREWAKTQKRLGVEDGPVVSLNTVKNWLQKVSMFFKWTLDRGFVRRNPARGVYVKVPPHRVKPTLTPEEMSRLAAACRPILGDLVRLIANTGLRIGEVLALQAADFDQTKSVLRILNSKGNRYDEMRVNSVVAGVLRRRVLQSAGMHLFPSLAGSALDRRNIRRDLIEAGKKVNVKAAGPQQLRRSFCTAMAPLVTAAVLKQLARHRDPRTTFRYYVNLQADAPPVVAL